jgi:hypothetical protein
MGLSFRKSKKIFPGVRINLTKKGIGISGGTKGLRVSHSATGNKTFSAGIPGSGIRYRKNLKNQKPQGPNLDNSFANRANQYVLKNPSTPQERKKVLKWLYMLLIFSALTGFRFDSLNLIGRVFSVTVFIILSMMYVKSSRNLQKIVKERRELQE